MEIIKIEDIEYVEVEVFGKKILIKVSDLNLEDLDNNGE